jgi:hypothetical protein
MNVELHYSILYISICEMVTQNQLNVNIFILVDFELNMIT